MNIVLADGTLTTIDNTSDLWWAVQGAGHNFGIVTSVTSKIYDIEYPDWAYKSYIFTGDKFSGVFDNVNKHLLKNGTQPVDITNYARLYNDPTTSDKVGRKPPKLSEYTADADTASSYVLSPSGRSHSCKLRVHGSF